MTIGQEIEECLFRTALPGDSFSLYTRKPAALSSPVFKEVAAQKDRCSRSSSTKGVTSPRGEGSGD